MGTSACWSRLNKFNIAQQKHPAQFVRGVFQKSNYSGNNYLASAAGAASVVSSLAPSVVFLSSCKRAALPESLVK